MFDFVCCCPKRTHIAITQKQPSFVKNALANECQSDDLECTSKGSERVKHRKQIYYAVRVFVIIHFNHSDYYQYASNKQF